MNNNWNSLCRNIILNFYRIEEFQANSWIIYSFYFGDFNLVVAIFNHTKNIVFDIISSPAKKANQLRIRNLASKFGYLFCTKETLSLIKNVHRKFIVHHPITAGSKNYHMLADKHLLTESRFPTTLNQLDINDKK